MAAEIAPGVPEEAVLYAAAALAVIVLLYLLSKLLGGGSKGDALVLAGPCEAGKTTLFMQGPCAYEIRNVLVAYTVPHETFHSVELIPVQLVKGDLHKLGTVTSMIPNRGSFKLPGGKGGLVKLIDIPGHRRVRHFLEKELPAARAVVFVLDSVEFSTSAYVKTSADMLFDVLARRSLQKARVPVLVACNKTDFSSAHSVDFIRKRLEKEIEQLRSTRTAMSDTSDKGAEEATVGKAGQTFVFAHCPTPVSFGGISVTQNELGPLFDFIKAKFS